MRFAGVETDVEAWWPLRTGKATQMPLARVTKNESAPYKNVTWV